MHGPASPHLWASLLLQLQRCDLLLQPGPCSLRRLQPGSKLRKAGLHVQQGVLQDVAAMRSGKP